ncbi:PH domain-containing protein [Candidatus Saccharibacteria bacterium]|nr:PH domain-containing protein [Candidatus Saccharibacteria bacterium]
MKTELARVQHARSAKDFPEIDLEQDEHVVLHIRRSRIGVIFIWTIVALMIIALSITLILLAASSSNNSVFSMNELSLRYLRLGIFALYVVIFFGGVVGQNIYNSNQIYVTNHRLIQKSRNSIFAHSTNIIELRRIEDVSFRQSSLVDNLFHIGMLRMSTVGEETTYSLKYVDTPRDEVKTISHLVYECKQIKDPSNK